MVTQLRVFVCAGASVRAWINGHESEWEMTNISQSKGNCLSQRSNMRSNVRFGEAEKLLRTENLILGVCWLEIFATTTDAFAAKWRVCVCVLLQCAFKFLRLSQNLRVSQVPCGRKMSDDLSFTNKWLVYRILWQEFLRRICTKVSARTHWKTEMCSPHAMHSTPQNTMF